MKEQPKTQKEEVLLYIEKYGNISTIEASNKLFIADLQGVIRNIKKERVVGYKWIYTRNHFGRPCRYKRYYLLDEGKETIFDRLRKLI